MGRYSILFSQKAQLPNSDDSVHGMIYLLLDKPDKEFKAWHEKRPEAELPGVFRSKGDAQSASGMTCKGARSTNSLIFFIEHRSRHSG